MPSYSRYGEAALRAKETLLIEEVQSGSRLYSLEIAAHMHRALYQVLWVNDGEANVRFDERRGLVVNRPANIASPMSLVAFGAHAIPMVWCLPLASDYWWMSSFIAWAKHFGRFFQRFASCDLRRTSSKRCASPNVSDAHHALPAAR